MKKKIRCRAAVRTARNDLWQMAFSHLHIISRTILYGNECLYNIPHLPLLLLCPDEQPFPLALGPDPDERAVPLEQWPGADISRLFKRY